MVFILFETDNLEHSNVNLNFDNSDLGRDSFTKLKQINDASVKTSTSAKVHTLQLIKQAVAKIRDKFHSL